MDFQTFETCFEFVMVSQRPRRYLKTFLDPVASLSQSMSPFRSTTTPFTPETTKSFQTHPSQTPIFPNSTPPSKLDHPPYYFGSNVRLGPWSYRCLLLIFRPLISLFLVRNSHLLLYKCVFSGEEFAPFIV